MIAVDTNVLVRALVDDDELQSRQARRWLTKHAAEGIVVDHIVLCEVIWVLRSRYRRPRADLTVMMGALLEVDGLIIPQEELVREALTAWREGDGDFADYLIRARVLHEGAAAVATFDSSVLNEKSFVRVS